MDVKSYGNAGYPFIVLEPKRNIGPLLIYIPLLNPNVKEGKPQPGDMLDYSTFNFVYNQEQADNLYNLVKIKTSGKNARKIREIINYFLTNRGVSVLPKIEDEDMVPNSAVAK